MSNNYFRFKQFTVYQDRCAMKVGTDGVLLGSWAEVPLTGRILDVGSGSGLIALMCAQRSHDALIEAVEIHDFAAKQSSDNFRASPWNDRLTCINDSFQHFASLQPARYDMIISNPPFYSNSLKPAREHRAYARHDDRLTYEELLFHSSLLLDKSGKLVVIIPSSDTDHFTTLAYFQNLYPARIVLVKPHERKGYSRALMEFSPAPGRKCSNGEIILKKSGTNEMTDEFKKLVSGFYLKINE